MRRSFLIILVLLGVGGLSLIGWEKFRTAPAPEVVLPGLEMVRVPSGTFELTILVPDLFGRKYYTKSVHIDHPFQISRYEITIDQWNACFAAGGCSSPAKQRPYQTGRHPVTRINWTDAMMFAQWLSEKTGVTFRLPMEEEWAYAAFAGKDFTKQTIEDLIANRQMIETASMSRFRKTLSIGASGENAWAIADMTGPVWEWTLTCRFSSDEENQQPWTISQLSDPDLCPNRIVQGDERSHVPFFVDKVYSGGCGTGSPVDHIGFRLVREVGRS